MTEWLTTGQMIDRLKVGEIAESDNPHPGDKKFAKISAGGLYYIEKGTRERFPFHVIDHYKTVKWRILPNYVSFDEAKTALEEGKKVKFQTPNGHWLEIENDTRIKGFSFDDFFSANWIIEDD